jgi:hypothetical protein
MEQTTISPITDLKTVKNSNAFYVGNEFICVHYSSVIFRAEKSPEGWITTGLYVPSVTSSKMARRCVEYLGIGEDWGQLKKRFS